MAAPSAFAPLWLPPGALPEEAVRRCADAGAGPLVASLDQPLPAGAVATALAEIPAGHAAAPEEACRAADGTASGGADAPRACPTSARHRARVEQELEAALAAGFAGACLDRPDAPLASGILGAGFCAECQRAFSRELTREYGEHFVPIDYLALAREAVAQAPGAVGFAKLPFGRDFWRFRVASMERALAAHARAARDAARAAGRAFDVVARFEAVGPAQLASARHLDAAVFPVKTEALGGGAGLFRLLRAALGRRPCAAALSGEQPAPAARRLAGVAAACGLEVVGLAAEAERGLGGLRRFLRAAGPERLWPAAASPVAECAVLYSAEADLWSGGDHREQVQRAGDALAALQLQAPVVLRVSDAPAGAALVLAGASALAPLEVTALKRRLEAGGGVVVFGELGAVDEAGRPIDPGLPQGKPAGVRVGQGTLVSLPPLPPPRPGGAPIEPGPLEPVARAMSVVLGRSRRAASVTGRSPVLVALYRDGERLEAHLVPLGAGPVQGATLFLGVHVAGAASRARFQSENGADERIVMNPSGYSISTVLPAFQGYAVLTVGA